MGRLVVLDPDAREGVTFLRGILTRSLQEAGLSFDDAYRIAATVREELGDISEVSTAKLRKTVVAHLKDFGKEAVSRYKRSVGPAPTIVVRESETLSRPYSRERRRVELQSSGVTAEDAANVAAKIYDDLTGRGVAEITLEDLHGLTLSHVEQELGARAARRYVTWQEFRDSKRPLIVLIGGAVGSGKSTVATELAHRMEIVRIQSTDMLREVMRMMMPARLLPVLHASTYTAGEVLPIMESQNRDATAALRDGYRNQAELVSVACVAVIKRALQEGVPLILEGVHIHHPSLLEKVPEHTDAVVVPVMLSVLRAKELRNRIRGRGKEVADRRAERYLSRFDEIWQIQKFMLSEADQAGVPIIPNDDLEKTVDDIIGTIMRVLGGDGLHASGRTGK